MERLTTLGALTLIIAVSACAQAQQVQYTVAGDVARPDSLAYDTDRQVSVQQLLRDAGVASNGQAVVIQGRQRHAFVETFYADSAGGDTVLTPGDIVIFHRFGGDQTVPVNVVVASQLPGVVRLSPTGHQVGSLLAHLQIPFAPGAAIPIIRTRMGRGERLQLPPEAVLVHGDVLLVDGVAPETHQRMQELFTASNPRQQSLPQDETSIPDDVASLAIESHGLRIPQPEVGKDIDAEPTAESPLTLVALETDVTPGGTAPTVVGDVVAPVTPGGDLQAAEVSPLWNGVFVLGLVGSLGLILTGWLKTRNELEASTGLEQGYQLQKPQEIPATATVATRVSPEVASPAPMPQPTPTPLVSEFSTSDTITTEPLPVARLTPAPIAFDTPGPEPVGATDTRVSRKQLVKQEEWFGGRWQDQSAASPSEQQGASTPAADEPPGPAVDPMVPPTVAAAATPTVESSPVSADFHAADDLEDLIRNRLPVQLQQADLPLHVSLFGRPAGPRRLRIDGAHQQIAAPHFAAVAQPQKQRESTTASIRTETPAQDHDVASLDRALNSLHGHSH